MNKSKITEFLLGMIVLVVPVATTVFLIRSMWNILSSADSTLSSGIIVAASTFIISISSILISKHFERKGIIENEHRKKKIPIYEELITFLFKVMMSEKLGKKPPKEQEVIKFMSEFTQKAIIWGADEVIDALYEFKQEGLTQTDKDPSKVIFCVENLLLSIRRDLGHKNKNLTKGKLLGLFINDIDMLIPNT